MGCSNSKLDNEEAVQLCKDRKTFIQQAVEQRTRLASCHNAYIESLRRVSASLRNYVEEQDPREVFLGSYLTPTKKSSFSIISLPLKAFSKAESQTITHSTLKVNCLRSGGNSSILVEESPPRSPETMRVESYPPIHNFGVDEIFEIEPSSINTASFHSFVPNKRHSFSPPSTQSSEWDFWNPFTSLDTYGYLTRDSIDHSVVNDENKDLKQVNEEDVISDLKEEKLEHKEVEEDKVEISGDETKIDPGDVITEDHVETETAQELGLKSHETESVEVAEAQNEVETEVTNTQTIVADPENEETPDFTVYVNRIPTNMAEVMKDIETQFMLVCDSATKLSTMMEASKVQFTPTSNELSAIDMLNPVALIRSASPSHSSSSRFFYTSSSSRDDNYDTRSETSEESSTFSDSHQSTLDRLYAWEKKLYGEVKSGARLRMAYEKKIKQLRNHRIKGEEHTSVVNKLKAAIRDLHTQINVSIHSVQAISKRIEVLREEELQSQVLELVQGLARMWKVMAECHQAQNRTTDEAKLLLASSPTEQKWLAQSALNLETDLRNWRACFESWMASQRSYVHALTGWLLRCIQCNTTTSKLPFYRSDSNGEPPLYGICNQWSRFLDTISELPVVSGMDFFAAGMSSLYIQKQLTEDSKSTPVGSKRVGSAGFPADSCKNAEIVEVQKEIEEEITGEKTAEVASKVLCAGMSAAISSLSQFAIDSANGYGDLVKQWEKVSQMQVEV